MMQGMVPSTHQVTARLVVDSIEAHLMSVAVNQKIAFVYLVNELLEKGL